jgi:pimeloyl-ACP methyl ester carboxylesterase
LASKYIEAIFSVQPPTPLHLSQDQDQDKRQCYYLGGWSFGAVVAFEVAHQLEKIHKQRVGKLVAIESALPCIRKGAYDPSFKLDANLASWALIGMHLSRSVSISGSGSGSHLPPLPSIKVSVSDLEHIPVEGRLDAVFNQCVSIKALPPHEGAKATLRVMFAMVQKAVELYEQYGFELEEAFTFSSSSCSYVEGPILLLVSKDNFSLSPILPDEDIAPEDGQKEDSQQQRTGESTRCFGCYSSSSASSSTVLVKSIEGNHHSVFSKPFVEQVAREIQEAIL